ncbi:MAG: hypothetical protein ACI8W7_004751, partial [Gammaproteobacteria bacterium]
MLPARHEEGEYDCIRLTKNAAGGAQQRPNRPSWPDVPPLPIELTDT